MKNLASLLLVNLVCLATSKASPTIDTTPGLGIRADTNWFTVTEYNSPSDFCEGLHTAQQENPYTNPSRRSGCKDVASGTTRLLFETNGPPAGYLVTFAKPGCVGPVTSNITEYRVCFAKKDHGPVMSYEAWRTTFE